MKNLTVESLELKIKELGGRLLELTLNNKTGDDKNYFEKVTTTDYECKLYCEKSIGLP